MTFAELNTQLETMRAQHKQIADQVAAHGQVLDAMQAEVAAEAARKPTIADVKSMLDQVEAQAK